VLLSHSFHGIALGFTPNHMHEGSLSRQDLSLGVQWCDSDHTGLLFLLFKKA